jgi:hypothetical protein
MDFTTSLDDIPDFLDSPAPVALMIPVVQLEPGTIDPRLQRMSYSSRLDLHACNRRFQLGRLQADRPEQDIKTSVTFAYGHAMGEGIQQYLIGRDAGHSNPVEFAIWKMFLAWDCDLLEENEKQKKSFLGAVASIMQFHELVSDGFLGSDYEVATFDGKPAAELSFRIDLGDGFTYRGYVDLVLRHKTTGQLVILELKTSSANYINQNSYKNSAQAIGYSVVLDKIAPGTSSYAVQYLVYLTKLQRYEAFDFPKTFRQRVQWLQHLIWDKKQISDMVAFYGNDGVWQTMGESCTDFGRDCDFMDICGMETDRITTPLTQNQISEDKEYQFEFTIEELVA